MRKARLRRTLRRRRRSHASAHHAIHSRQHGIGQALQDHAIAIVESMRLGREYFQQPDDGFAEANGDRNDGADSQHPAALPVDARIRFRVITTLQETGEGTVTGETRAISSVAPTGGASPELARHTMTPSSDSAMAAPSASEGAATFGDQLQCCGQIDARALPSRCV